MQASAIRRVGPSERFPWAGAGVCLAALLGMATAFSPKLGVALGLGLALAAAIVFRPKLILPLLAASVFVEEVTVGGVAVSRLLAPLALGVVIAVVMRKRLTIGATSPLIWVGAYSLWALASVAWTISGGDTRFKLFSLAIALVYLLAVATLIESQRELRGLVLAIAVASLLIGLFAIATVVLGISSELQAGRPNGGAGDPNLFAAYQVVALPPTLTLAASTARRSLRLLLVCAALVEIASVFVSESRGGLLALTVVMLLIVVFPARRLFRVRTQKSTVVILIVLAGGVGLASIGAPLVGRIESLKTTDPTGSGRVFLWKAARTSIRERPLLGVGYGSFPAAAPNLLRETPGIDFRHIELHVDRKASEAHSVYIGALAELGIPGLALFVLILLSTGRLLIHTARRARMAGAGFVGRMANALLLSLIGWSVASIFLSTESSRSLWTLIGVSLALPKLIGTEPPDDVVPAPPASASRAASRW